MLNHAKRAIRYIVELPSRIDDYLYEHNLLVYGDLKQQMLAQAIFSTLGCLIGLAIGTCIVVFCF